ALNLVSTPEVPLEHQLAAACDQNGVHVSARSRESIGHPAQRSAIGELLIIGGDYRPAVVSCHRNTAAIGRVRIYRQRNEGGQCSSTEKRSKRASPHSILSFTPSGRPTYQMILLRAVAETQTRASPRSATDHSPPGQRHWPYRRTRVLLARRRVEPP